MSRLKSLNAIAGIAVALMMVLGTSAGAYAAGKVGSVHSSACDIRIWDFFPSTQNDNERTQMLTLANAWEKGKGGGGCAVTEPIQPAGGYETPFINGPKGAGDIIMLPDDQEGVVWNDHLIAPTSINKSAYLPDALQGVVNGGKTYAYPMFLETMMLYYNPKLIKSSVFKGKYTWNSVAAAAKACVSSSKCQYGMGWQWDNVYDDAQFLQSLPGAGYFAQSGSGFNYKNVLLNSKGTVAGLNYLKSIIGAAGWSGSAVDTFLGANGGDGTATALFESGKLGMLDIGPWGDGEFKQAKFSDYKVAAPPWLKSGGKLYQGTPFVGVQDLVINKFSSHVKQAESLANYLSLHAGLGMYKAGGRLPATKAQFNSLGHGSEITAYRAALGHVRAMPNIPQMGNVWGPTGSELTLFIEGKISAQAAMNKAAAAVKKSDKK